MNGLETVVNVANRRVVDITATAPLTGIPLDLTVMEEERAREAAQVRFNNAPPPKPTLIDKTDKTYDKVCTTSDYFQVGEAPVWAKSSPYSSRYYRKKELTWILSTMVDHGRSLISGYEAFYFKPATGRPGLATLEFVQADRFFIRRLYTSDSELQLLSESPDTLRTLRELDGPDLQWTSKSEFSHSEDPKAGLLLAHQRLQKDETFGWNGMLNLRLQTFSVAQDIPSSWDIPSDWLQTEYKYCLPTGLTEKIFGTKSPDFFQHSLVQGLSLFPLPFQGFNPVIRDIYLKPIVSL